MITMLEYHAQHGSPPEKKAFFNHPATQQWVGYIDALKNYFNIHHDEVVLRNCCPNMKMLKYDLPATFVNPWFMSVPHFWFSHRSSMFDKDKKYYSHLVYPKMYDQYGYFYPHYKKHTLVSTSDLMFNRLSPSSNTEACLDQRLKSILDQILCPPRKPDMRAKCPALLRIKKTVCGVRIKSKKLQFCGRHNK